MNSSPTAREAKRVNLGSRFRCPSPLCVPVGWRPKACGRHRIMGWRRLGIFSLLTTIHGGRQHRTWRERCGQRGCARTGVRSTRHGANPGQTEHAPDTSGLQALHKVGRSAPNRNYGVLSTGPLRSIAEMANSFRSVAAHSAASRLPTTCRASFRPCRNCWK